MIRTIDGALCKEIHPSQYLRKRATSWMQGPYRAHPGYWVKLTSRIYAYREHTGNITFWRRNSNA